MQDKEEKVVENSEQLNSLTVEANSSRDFWEFVIDLLKTGVIVFAIAFLLRYFAVQPYKVDGESMMPNYVDKEYLLAEKISYSIRAPQRGDVIIFKYPKNPSLNYIKRIIGLPGETVKIGSNKIDIFNSQYPNGFTMQEGYIPTSSKTYTFEGNTLEVTLKSDEYFVLGDNREHSSDSREWGILPKTNILGRAWLTLYPFDKIGFHSQVDYSKMSLADPKSFALLPAVN